MFLYYNYVLYYSWQLCHQMKGNKMNTKQGKHVVYDDISGYGITIINNVMYLIKDGKEMKLDSLIIKERKGN